MKEQTGLKQTNIAWHRQMEQDSCYLFAKEKTGHLECALCWSGGSQISWESRQQENKAINLATNQTRLRQPDVRKKSFVLQVQTLSWSNPELNQLLTIYSVYNVDLEYPNHSKICQPYKF